MLLRDVVALESLPVFVQVVGLYDRLASRRCLEACASCLLDRVSLASF